MARKKGDQEAVKKIESALRVSSDGISQRGEEGASQRYLCWYAREELP